jgi:hypothetical protein
MLPRHLVAAIATAGIAATALPAVANAYVTPQAAQLAADRAVAWYRTQQQPTGDIGGGGDTNFGGDWSMIALSNAGVNAADLQTGIGDPSLQDYYADTWAGASSSLPGGASTDQARALLTGFSGGIRGATLSASRNLLARQLRFFDGKQLGLTSTVNDDMFGQLALRENGVDDLTAPLDREVRKAQTQGGWNYTTNGGAPDIDMTGAGIATLCADGATPSDPAVAAGLAYIHTMQDDATGGFFSDYFGVNSDSTSWVVNGLRQCGIDPQSAEWTTASGKTPLDFLAAMQKTNGAFRWRPSEADDNSDNLYSTQDSVTAMVGDGFTAPPADRTDAADAKFRPAADVAPGTTVPVALLIDHGAASGDAQRACSVKVPVDGTVADALANVGSADPAGCAADLKTSGSGGAAELTSVNGVSADAGHKWVVSVDGGPERDTLGADVPLGAVVRAKLVTLPGAGGTDDGGSSRTGSGTTTQPAATPAPLPSVVPVQGAAPLRAKATLRVGTRLVVRGGRVALVVGCPRGLGAAGCLGVVRITYTSGKRTVVAGSAEFRVTSGASATVRVRLTKAFRKLVAHGVGHTRGRAVTVTAATRDQNTRSTTTTRATTRVRG